MPTYEYECTKCGAVVDVSQSITEPARKKLKKGDPKPCTCDAPVRRRIGTGGGVIFKGTGFYTTDYRSESYKNAAKAEKDSSDGASKSASSDAKPSKKTESTKSESTSGGTTKANGGSTSAGSKPDKA